jgi:hypothetical protein
LFEDNILSAILKLSKYNHINSTKIIDAISYALLIFLFFTIFLTFKDYGISWDEIYQAEYGRMTYEYFRTFGADKSSFTYMNSYYYGPVVELICHFIFTTFPSIGLYEIRHLISALIGAVGVIGCYKIGKLCGGSTVGLISIITICLFPSYYGHLFINSKDIPFAAGSIWSLYYSIKLILELPCIRFSNFLKLGFIIGLSLAIRVGAVIFWGYFLLGTLIWAVVNFKNLQNFWLEKTLLKFTSKLVVYFLATFTLSYILMVMLWPAAHNAALSFPYQALVYFSNFERQTQDTLQYLLTYLPVKIPEILLILVPVGIFIIIHDLIKKQFHSKEFISIVILFICFIFPLILVVIKKSYLYNELRHVLFTLPTLALFVVVSVNRFLQIYNGKLVKLGLTLIFTLHSILISITLFKLHPYQYIYYNHISGGISEAYKKQLPLDYWCTSYKEISGYFLKSVRSKGPEVRKKSFLLYSHGPFWAADLYLRNKSPKILSVGTPQEADYIISYTDNRADKNWDAKTIYKVERFSTPISVLAKVTSD